VKYFNFFDCASPSLMALMRSHSHEVSFEPGDILIMEGDTTDSIYIVESGLVEAKTTDAHNMEPVLAVLGAGALFGEMSWLENTLPVATVQAKTKSQVLKIPTKTLESLIHDDLEFACELMKHISHKLALQITSQNEWIFQLENSSHLVQPIRKVLTFFSGLEEEDIYMISEIGELIRLRDGEVLIKEGQDLSFIYLVMAGELDVKISMNGVIKTVGSSRRGEMLGELSYLNQSQSTATATVICRDGVELLQIDKTKLSKSIESSSPFGYRFYRSLACMLSQRSRDQLSENNLSRRTINHADQNEDEIDLGMIGSINRAGLHFSWLCDKFQTANNQ